jgi:hypothetical protein
LHRACWKKIGDPIYPPVYRIFESLRLAIAVYTIWCAQPVPMLDSLEINLCDVSFPASEPFALERVIQYFLRCNGSVSALIAETNDQDVGFWVDFL